MPWVWQTSAIEGSQPINDYIRDLQDNYDTQELHTTAAVIYVVTGPDSENLTSAADFTEAMFPDGGGAVTVPAIYTVSGYQSSRYDDGANAGVYALYTAAQRQDPDNNVARSLRRSIINQPESEVVSVSSLVRNPWWGGGS